MGRFGFYLHYAARNLRRSGRWSIFAVFCIAAGVATVVALRSLGLAIQDTLTSNVQQSNHGDILLFSGSRAAFGAFGPMSSASDTFDERDVRNAETWAEANSAQMTQFYITSNVQITAVDTVTSGRPQYVAAYLVDPATFPPTDPIVALEPAGVRINDLLAGERSIVISRNLADLQGLAVGDPVRVSGTEETFTITGIVATEYESSIENIIAAFFGFAYIDQQYAAMMSLPELPNRMSFTLPSGTDIDAKARDLINVVPTRYDTVPEIIERNTFIGDYIGRFIVIMGLGALLIGGIGIINTMLVIVRRRTMEIAALKTFGLNGRQVAAMFTAEAFLLGLIGSLVGVVAGLGLSLLVNQYGEAFLQQRLVWRFQPEVVLYGMAIGIPITVVFGVLPILLAARVRPGIILRPNESHVTGAGCLQSLLALILVVLVVGVIAGQILGNVPIGMIAVAVTLIVLGVLVGLLWVVVWLVGKLPAFGNVDLKLALRNLSTRRIRTATTLLALSGGMFALSSLTFFGQGTLEIVNFTLTNSLGGNVLLFPLLPGGVGQALVNARVATLDGVTYTTRIENYSGWELELLDGQEVVTLAEQFDAPQRAQNVSLQSRDTTNPTPRSMAAGRDLTAEDRGKQVAIASANPQLEGLGLHVGSILTLRNGRQTMEFEVVGISSSTNLFGDAIEVPPGSLSQSSSFQFNVLQVADEKLNDVLLSLTSIPLVFALDISFIDGLLRRIIDQFSAIPTVVGLLSLLAAAVAMANTVALATMERRHQIGILKAIGLKGRRVLWVMLLENTLIGLLGGAIGIGLSALGVAIMTAVSTGTAVPIPRDATLIAVLLVVASVVIAWVATILSARVAVAERALNVLRYE